MEKIEKSEILGSHVSLYQPSNGYRVSIDSILLAATIPAQPKDIVLDVGSGTGAASLALAARLSSIRVEGIEIQSEYTRLARKSAKKNKFEKRIHFINADISNPKLSDKSDKFNHVMTNPPFLERGRGRESKNPGKVIANMESEVGLTEWINFCVRSVRSRGTVTLIHRVDRLEQILAAFNGKVGDLIIFPLWSGAVHNTKVRPARRVIIQGRKGIKSPTQIKSGLVLHETDGTYTEMANEILSYVKNIDLKGSGETQ